jgi:hypothetical protein
VKLFPSISKSLASTTIVTGFAPSVVAVSLLAVTVLSASTTGSTSILKIAVSQACGVPSSHTVYVNSVVPVNPGSGVKV